MWNVFISCYFCKLHVICNLFVSFILVLTVFVEFLKNFNKQQFVNRRLTKSLEQYQVVKVLLLKQFKVAPYSFTIARALRTREQVICARSKENVIVFRYSWRQHEHKKQTWQWIFSLFLRWNSVILSRLVVNGLL